MSGRAFLRRSTAKGFVLSLALAGDVAEASPVDRVLEGARGDRVTILLADRTGSSADTVTVCLFDGTARRTAKAFDVRAGRTPRHRTDSSERPACGTFTPTAHVLVFFVALPSGDTREVMRTRFDLSGLHGRRIDAVWTRLPVSEPARTQ